MAELPAGYKLDAPAQTAALPAGYTLDGQSAPPSAPVSLWGLVKSAGSGVVRGLESGASALGQAAAIEQGGDTNGVPDAKQTQDILDKNVTGKLYEPQNAAERIVHAGGAAIGANPPLAAMTGPLSTFGAGASSEGAHELLKGTPLDMPAQLLAPVLMGKAANTARGVVNGAVSKMTGKTADLTQDQLFNTADKQFDALHNSDIELHPLVGENWAGPMAASLEKRGLDVDTAPFTTKTLNSFIGRNTPLTATDIVKTRGKLGKLSQETDARGIQTPEGEAAQDALKSFDDLVTNPQNIQPQAVLNGDLGAFQKGMQDAVGNWGAARRLDRWNTAMNDAENNAGAANSGAGLGNAMRQSAKKFVNGSAKSARGMTDDETDVIQNFVRGSTPLNLTRDVGNMLGGGKGVAAGGAILGGLAAGAPGMVAAPVVGTAARWLYNNRTQAAANDIATMLAQRSPMAQSMGATPSIQDLLGAARAMHLSERVARAARGPEGVWAAGQ